MYVGLLFWVACSSSWTGGIQAVLTRRAEGPLRVVDVPPDSAADRAGLREGDEIVTIDDVAVSGRTTADAVARLRGDVGSHVVLGVRRGDERLNVRIERGPFGERFGRDRSASARRRSTPTPARATEDEDHAEDPDER